MQPDAPKIVFRERREADLPFIFSTWLRGLRSGNDLYGLIDTKAYFEVYHRVIETILATPGITVKVACFKDDPDTLLGYAVFDAKRVHWVHVKKEWRRIGLAKDLLPPFNQVSHVTKVGLSILKTKKPDFVFNPFF